MSKPSEKLYQSLIDELVTELEYGRSDIESQYRSWIEKNGSSSNSKGEFFRQAFQLGRDHYSKNYKDELDKYQKLRKIENLFFQLLVAERKKVTPAIKAINEIDILKAGLNGFRSNVEIIANHNQCKYAEQFDGIKLSYEEALNGLPIDYTRCDRDLGCICMVGFEPVRDSDGRLVKR